MRISFLASIWLFLFTSCSPGEPVPEGLLEKPEMVSILIEIHMIEAKLSELKIPDDSAQVLYKAYEQQLFENIGVAESTYRNSYDWHFTHIESLNKIYDAVVDSLNLRLQTQRLRK